MSLLAVLFLPLLGGLLAWAAGRHRPQSARWVALATLAATLLLALAALPVAPGGDGPWHAQWRGDWIPRFGIAFHLGLDGLSLTLVLLTLFLGGMAVVASWTEIRRGQGLFHLLLLATVTGANGVFLAVDLFLFFVFWEAMLVPMYLLIALWGHGGRLRAAVKFFLFTQASGLLMLAAIVALMLLHGAETGAYSTAYADLAALDLAPGVALWVMAGFLLAFAVKLPAVPLHSWLADAHTEAPTGGSVLLAGVLLKTGAYGLLRFVLPLFPEAAAAVAPALMALGVAGIVYGAVLAFAQSDLKRLVAYTSVSHMGFVLLGVFAGGAFALRGALMGMVAHGLSTGALFMVAGAVQERLGTRDMNRMGGLWGPLPRLGAVALFFALGALGLPGLGNFVGEFLVLLGTFQRYPVAAVLAASALVLSAAYALALIQRVFHGQGPARNVPDLGPGWMAAAGAMMLLLLWLGLFPQPLFETAGPALDGLTGAGGG